MQTQTVQQLEALLESDMLSAKLAAAVEAFLAAHGNQEISPEDLQAFLDAQPELQQILTALNLQDVAPAAGDEAVVLGNFIGSFQDATSLAKGFNLAEIATFQSPQGAGPLGQAHVPTGEHTIHLAQASRGGSSFEGGDLNQGGDGGGEAPTGPLFHAIDAVRNITGEGNNADHATWGMSHTALMNAMDYAYDDGFSSPHDANMPNAREVSNVIFSQSGDMYSSSGMSNLFWVWGQFIDHDLTLTTGGQGEAYNIAIPQGDPYFDPYGTGTAEMSLTRSGYMEGTGTDASNPRLQVNELTSFLDASQVYGSDAEKQAALRDTGGYMKINADGTLPVQMGSMGPEFLAGDERANENVALTSMHTLFVREHNHWVDVLKADNPEMSDEQLYQTAKALVEAEIQHITYTEFLPALIGTSAIDAYSGYDSTVNPMISTEFATAAFRVGHTMLSSDIFRLNEDGSEFAYGNLSLRDAFFRPDIIMTQGGIDEILRGVAGSMSQEIDASIIDDIRNFLFVGPGQGGFDLATLNIQRGRDHGLEDFNSYREAYGLEKYQSFLELTDGNVELADRLEQLYGSIDNVDLWVGGLIEAPAAGALVGETFQAIIADQFTRVRDGDSFWYEERLDDTYLNIINHTSLADIIQRNTDIEFLQNDALVAANRIGGTSAADQMTGTENADLIIGFEGNDVIDGGKGADTLYGGDGSDLFILKAADLGASADVIRDFGAGDKIDLSDFLGDYDASHGPLSDYVYGVKNGHDLTIMVDQDGAGDTYTAQAVVVLENVETLDPSQIILQQGQVA
ncbi:MAG: peroxidase family protein [Pseudobdellovibrionaceae bacterium]